MKKPSPKRASKNKKKIATGLHQLLMLPKGKETVFTSAEHRIKP